MQLIGVVGFVLEKEKNRLPFQICSLSGCLWVLLLEMLQGSAYPLKLGTSLQKKKKKKTKAKALLPHSYLQRGSSAFPWKQGLAVQNALQVRTNSAQENYKLMKSVYMIITLGSTKKEETAPLTGANHAHVRVKSKQGHTFFLCCTFG